MNFFHTLPVNHYEACVMSIENVMASEARTSQYDTGTFTLMVLSMMLEICYREASRGGKSYV